MHNRVVLQRFPHRLIALAPKYDVVPSLALHLGKSRQHVQRLEATSANILAGKVKVTLSDAHRAADGYIQHDCNLLFQRLVARR